MKKSLIVLALLLAGSHAAGAVETVAPQASQSAMPQGSYLGAPKDIYRVFIFGDGLANAVFGAMKTEASTDALIRIDGRTNEESGLARPEIHDWNVAIPKVQQGNPMEIAVLMMGVNDSQPLREGQKVLVVGSPGWAEAYGARVDRLLNIFKKRGTAVYWLGLPPMGAPELDASVKLITDVQKQRVQAAGIKYISLRDAVGLDWRVMRSSNGVNLSRQGSEKVAELVLASIRADISVAFGAGESAGLSPAQAVAPQIVTPLFGQPIAVGDGAEDDGLVRPSYRPPSTVVTGDASVVAGRLLAERLSESTLPGSSAEALFLKGSWPAPKPGRVDDFSLSGAATTSP